MILALFGIPLTAIMLAGIGEKLKNAMKMFDKLETCSRQSTERQCKVFQMLMFCLGGILVLMIVPSFVFRSIELLYFT